MKMSFSKTSCLIFGCGNILFGDDGFGPEVIKHLKKNYKLPAHVACLDVGTSVQGILFDIILSEEKPNQIIIVDTLIDGGHWPGYISEIEVESIKPEKRSNFSVHEFPSIDMLRDIKDFTDIDLRILVVEAEKIPSEVCPGLSKKVKEAVADMCEKIISIVNEGRDDRN